MSNVTPLRNEPTLMPDLDDPGQGTNPFVRPDSREECVRKKRTKYALYFRIQFGTRLRYPKLKSVEVPQPPPMPTPAVKNFELAAPMLQADEAQPSPRTTPGLVHDMDSGPSFQVEIGILKDETEI